jgi:predicted lipoprotein
MKFHTIHKYKTFVNGAAAAALIFTFALNLASCKDDEGNQNLCLHDFDVKPLLSHYSKDIIIPAYDELKAEVTALRTHGDRFVNTPTTEHLDSFQAAFTRSYLAWQTAAPFDFGPAETHFLTNGLNNYPLNQGQTLAKIQAIDTNLSSPDEYTKGFPALDLLLFGLGDDNATVDSFTTNLNYRYYTRAVVNDIVKRVSAVSNDWNSFADDFNNRIGTASGEGLSLIINGLNKNYEQIKRTKIGVPSGVLSLGFTNPTEVEAYHSGISLELITRSLEASKEIFNGKGSNSLASALDYIEAEKNGDKLSTLINDQFDLGLASVKQLNGRLSDLVDSDNEAVLKAYKDVAEQVVLLKSDMPSVMCIAITYVDNPSDSD